MDFGFASVTAITVIVYFATEIIKNFPIDTKWLPAICGLMGAILGIVGYFAMTDFPAPDILTAICVGIASGFAATGVNQVYKQLTKDE